ncbi:hypothetical protein [Aerococcus christensenii]|uniref:Uncharacterized protein n=1 Tax=Aerococcus christensenii TaxID=87541 RepID=A0A0X8F7B2_9LACT|nr:hypothetical protein [Aerococcus christensenii]AMB92150.1 hypothetical protein AWM71_01915 [Aerococcus christensenii]KXB37758.1 hypothetical protein HMPREF3187_00475 [Aerococcus christensenii]MDK8233393.1 hypothetical protein [Aerococcus christensenii]WEB70735.1 hypothetical protein PUW42_06750 [Aerococcus christensenii]
MSNKIRAALTFAQNQELQHLQASMAKQDVSRILQTVQNFVDTYEEYFEQGQVNLFAIEAQPNLRQHTARTAFVMINLTGKSIKAFNAHLEFKVNDFAVQFEDVDWEIPSEFLGNWASGFAIMVVDDIPMQGTPTKANYSLDDLDLTVSDVTVVDA